MFLWLAEEEVSELLVFNAQANAEEEKQTLIYFMMCLSQAVHVPSN